MEMRVYGRLGTSDKQPTPETQLVHLRDFCAARGWEIYREYVDTATALGMLLLNLLAALTEFGSELIRESAKAGM